MTESQIQSKIIKQLEKEGYYVIKLISTNKAGISDLIALKDGKAIFIEVKTENGILSELQKLRRSELKKQGFDYYVWTDYQKEFNENATKNDNRHDF